MSLKKFNHEYSSIPSGEATYSTEDEAHLHCLLKETIVNSRAEDFIDEIQHLPLTLHNLHQVITKCCPKSGPFGKTIELIENMILALKDQQHLVQSVHFLPVLTDILLRSSSRTEHILKMIQDISFGITIKACQSFLERLIKYCVDILCSETAEHEVKIRIVTLSVLINLCSNNAISLTLLEQQINVMDLQKQIPLETYGILSCKMSLVLNECGHILRESDVRNFLKYTSKELHRIPVLDEKSLKHLIEFIRDISQRSNTKQILQQYDFGLGIKSAIMTLENTTDDRIGLHINSLFEIIKIVMIAKNNSLNNLIITIVNFAIKRLRSPDCCIQAMEMLTTIFSHESKISSNNFELEEMQGILSAILFSNDRQSAIMAPLFKLLNVLAKNYKVNLVKNQVVESIFAPLLRIERSKYFKLPIGDITMYLECLVMLSTLCELQILETKLNIFQETNVQFLVAMSMKHGNTDQCCLALSLMSRFSNRVISEMISSKDSNYKVGDPYQFMQNNQGYVVEKDLSTELGRERVKNVFFNIEKANLNDKVNVPSSDFITLYTTEIARLKQQIEILTKKYEDVSKELVAANGHNLELQITSMKWSELAQNLQRSNETIITENEKLNTIVTSLRSKYKISVNENDEAVRKLAQEKNIASKKIKELEEKVQSLEDEIKETEDMRQTILSVMTKRKKPKGKDT